MYKNSCLSLMAVLEDKTTYPKPEDSSSRDEYTSVTVNLEVPSGPQCYWKSLPFLTAYHFMCKKCNSNDEEVFSRKQANFAVMCQTALANLMWRHGGRLYFSKENELIPFLEEFWEELTTQPRKSNNSWYPNIHKTLTSSDAFKTVEIGADLLVCLANTDIGKMGPSYDRFRALTSQLRTNITKLGLPSANTTNQTSNESTDLIPSECTGEQDAAGDTVGWRKRKSPGSGVSTTGSTGINSSLAAHGSTNGASSGIGAHHTAGGLVGSNGAVGPDTAEFPARPAPGRLSGTGTSAPNGSVGGSLVRSTRRAGAAGLCGAAAVSGGPASAPDEGRTKLNALGFPVDHPFNKEGYRYILVEQDRHAPGRDLWDDCEQTAGKPIPGIFYRVFLSPQVVLSVNDRANHLKLHESQLMITGEKGYCMARATHGVHTGTWYYEAMITDQPECSATRIGWSQLLGECASLYSS
ncbi:unnamed protein product [Dicrocoelium dendriticum]|nr:unnamed protein product [Dicrocoelium dendriticum]